MVTERPTQAAPENSVEYRSAASQRPFQLPVGSTEIILVRHGASADAVRGRAFPLVNGRGDPELSPAGERQAQAAARRLASEPIDGLFVTPLRRTHLSAAPLAAALALDPVVIDELIEVSLGDWEGGEYRLRAAAGDPIVLRAHAEERWDLIPGGESAESLARRVRAGIERIVALTGPDRGAVAYLHGAVIGEACRQATASRPFAFVHSDNGSISRLVIGPDGTWLLRSFNDISHLDGVAG
ncbi:MAG TPA: histidine phosphatase family protein [Solirubrobacteraceae bacterium]|nr:histidine phosphatase family protein [Solirubrobacteraceae bacterium]